MTKATGARPNGDSGDRADGSIDSLFAATPALLAVASPDLRLTAMNPAWRRVLGIAPDELTGRDLLELIHPDDRGLTEIMLRRVLEGATLDGFVNRVAGARGGDAFIEWRAQTGADGLLYLSATDVTETQALKDRLRTSNARLAQVAEIAGIGGWSLELDSQHLQWDARTRRIHELPEDYEPDLESAINFYAPEARPVIEGAVQNGIETGEGWDLILPMITAKNRRIWVRASGRVVRSGGQPVRLTGTFQDVTDQQSHAERLEAALAEADRLRVAERTVRDALKESEYRLQSAADAADIGVWTFRPEEDRLYFSPRCSALIGLPEFAREMSGSEYEALLHPDDRDAVIAAIYEHLAGRRDGYVIEARYHHASGAYVWTESHGRVVERDEKGRALLMCGTFQNIENRKAHERLLEDSRAAAEAANRAKSQFLANMSHEIRTPLNGVLGIAQLLEREDLTETQRRYVSTLRESGRALLALIEDILDISQIEAGRLELVCERFDLNAVLGAVRDVVAAEVETRGLALSIDLDPDVSPARFGDEKHLRQVLINLVGNAVKFTKAGSVRVQVARAEHDRLAFSVTDTGPGVPTDKLQHIFNRFAQADDSAAREHGGTGLGLAISKELVELAGGRIGVDSELGAGARFWFEWPLPPADGPNAAAPAPGSAPDRQPNGAPGARASKILVAEDQPVNRALMEEWLESAGFEPVLVENGRDALAYLETERPDAILMDIHMPVMSGDAAIREIRARRDASARIPIIALTADATAETAQRLKGLGIDGCLIKPVQFDEVLDTLGAALGRARPPGP